MNPFYSNVKKMHFFKPNFFLDSLVDSKLLNILDIDVCHLIKNMSKACMSFNQICLFFLTKLNSGHFLLLFRYQMILDSNDINGLNNSTFRKFLAFKHASYTEISTCQLLSIICHFYYKFYEIYN
jgi:hypothetical protein